MDIWKHCLMSQRKFGGQPGDYFPIHRFIDSSKLYYFHAKHRLLLHHAYGIELACDLFGDVVHNSQRRVILVRDIAAEHCKEDLFGLVPSLYDWLRKSDDELRPLVQVPGLGRRTITSFRYAALPALRTALIVADYLQRWGFTWQSCFWVMRPVKRRRIA